MGHLRIAAEALANVDAEVKADLDAAAPINLSPADSPYA
jgi:hypothetical protein